MYSSKDKFNDKIAEMTTEQKLGMLYCARRFEEEDMDFIIEMVKKRALGCVQSYPQRPEITKRILQEADYPILMICDTERGFPTSTLPKTPLISLAACNKKEYYHSFAKGIVRDAKEAGFNGTWGPVIDVLLCDGPGKVSRYFSDNPHKGGEAAEEIASIFKQEQLSTKKSHLLLFVLRSVILVQTVLLAVQKWLLTVLYILKRYLLLFTLETPLL